MQQPCFEAVVDAVPEIAGQFVVCLGRPAQLPPLPPERLLLLEGVDEAALDRIARLDPRRMAAGLVVVTTRAEHGRNPRDVLRAQKLLALLYTKFVDLPVKSTRIPDPMGLRAQDTPPEYLHLLNKYRNTPLHLQHCLVDKLRDQAVGLPCLLLLPGPSLQLLKDQLPELARRYLIVTISRVLPMLRQCGVTPDVLVQLDTVPLQEHFHHPEDRFPESVLLSLSLAPIRNFAPRFRQLFFIDSFDLAMLPNPTRLRESWLSSLLACLGATEALHAPRVLLAGVDLRLHGNNIYYAQDAGSLDAPLQTEPLTSAEGKLFTSDLAGRVARTSLQFFATAAEAELFARAINASTGASFHNLSPWSLLDPDTCQPMSVEQALAAPVLDKSPFLAKADQAAAQREHILLEPLRAQYAEECQEAERSCGILTCLGFADPEARRQHPCYRYAAANFPWFRPTGADNLGRVAENLARELSEAARFARNVAALHCQAAKGAPVPVLCIAEEEEETLACLGRLRPGWAWRCLGIQALDAGRPQPSGGALDLAVLHDWLRFQKVLVVAPGCEREFRYALSLIGSGNAVALEDLLAYSPQC